MFKLFNKFTGRNWRKHWTPSGIWQYLAISCASCTVTWLSCDSHVSLSKASHAPPTSPWNLRARIASGGRRKKKAQHTAAAESVSHFVCQSCQMSSNVIKCHQFIIFYNSLYHLISLSQIVSIFDRSHFGTRPNCKRWSCPAVLRKKQEGQFQWSKWTKPWPNPRPWSQIPALSKRVRHAFKKCPYLERSKDLTHLRHPRQTLKGLVSTHASYILASRIWNARDQLLHHASSLARHVLFSDVLWPYLIRCFLIGLCDEVSRRPPVI